MNSLAGFGGCHLLLLSILISLPKLTLPVLQDDVHFPLSTNDQIYTHTLTHLWL